MGRQIETSLRGGPRAGIGPDESSVLALGWLSFLASFCPMHRRFPQEGLSRLFLPAINNDCVRFFRNDDGHICAALIWARLSDDVSQRMIYDQVPPDAREWDSGENLWFLDILAPFGHGGMVARHIARNPPDGPFYFARLGKGGAVKKVVRGDALRRTGRVSAFHLNTDSGGPA
jgi:cytolysin-activating lysine-acyltransferase